MSAEWFLVNDGKELGPFSAKQLKELANSGSLERTQLLRRADKRKTVRAEKVAGLFTPQPPSDTSSNNKSSDQVTIRRPPPPPSRLGAGSSTTAQTAASDSAVQQPTTSALPNGGTPGTTIPVPARQRGLNPNVTFVLGVWAGLGLCSAAFAFLATTGRLAPLVAWLEEAGGRKEELRRDEANAKAGQPGKQGDEKRQEDQSPLESSIEQQEATAEPDKHNDSEPSSSQYRSGYNDSSVRSVMLTDTFMHPPQEALILRNERVTADYFPHDVGAFTVSLNVNYIISDDALVFLKKYVNDKPDGEIRSEGQMVYFTKDDGSLITLKSLPSDPESSDLKWIRVKDGYVEVNSAGLSMPEKLKPWRRALKLGVGVGDSWPVEDFNEIGQATVETIFQCEGRPCAVIRERTTSSPLGHSQNNETMTWYLKGVGPVRWSYSHDGFGKGMMPIAREIIQLRNQR